MPEAYGGLGLSTLQYAAVLKELAKIHGGIRAMLHVHNSSVHMIETGRPEQRQRYLPAMATGDLLVCFRPDRTGQRVGPRQQLRGGAARRRLHPERPQAPDHQRREALSTNARERTDLFAVFCFTHGG